MALKTFSTKAFGGFIELRQFEKKGRKWNKVTKHIVRLPEGCNDYVQYLRDLIHQDDMYKAGDDYMIDHRFFYYMADNDRYALSEKLEAKREEIEEKFAPEQKEFANDNYVGEQEEKAYALINKLSTILGNIHNGGKKGDIRVYDDYSKELKAILKKALMASTKTESVPYVAKTEDGAELNPANKGEKMFGDSEFLCELPCDATLTRKVRANGPDEAWQKALQKKDVVSEEITHYSVLSDAKYATPRVKAANGSFSEEKTFDEGCKYDWRVVIVRPKNDPSLKLKRYLSDGWHEYNPQTHKEDGPVKYAIHKDPTTSSSNYHVTEEELEKGVDRSGNRLVVTDKTWNNESEEATDLRKAGFSDDPAVFLENLADDEPYEVARAIVDALTQNEAAELIGPDALNLSDYNLPNPKGVIMNHFRNINNQKAIEFAKKLIEMAGPDALMDAKDSLDL